MIYKNLVHKLEYTVLELSQSGMTDVDIHSLVNMTLQGWLVDGQPTLEYLQLAKAAKDLKKEDAEGISRIDTSAIRGFNS